MAFFAPDAFVFIGVGRKGGRGVGCFSLAPTGHALPLFPSIPIVRLSPALICNDLIFYFSGPETGNRPSMWARRGCG
jgi:hypothetical protein